MEVCWAFVVIIFWRLKQLASSRLFLCERMASEGISTFGQNSIGERTQPSLDLGAPADDVGALQFRQSVCDAKSCLDTKDLMQSSIGSGLSSDKVDLHTPYQFRDVSGGTQVHVVAAPQNSYDTNYDIHTANVLRKAPASGRVPMVMERGENYSDFIEGLNTIVNSEGGVPLGKLYIEAHQITSYIDGWNGVIEIGDLDIPIQDLVRDLKNEGILGEGSVLQFHGCNNTASELSRENIQSAVDETGITVMSSNSDQYPNYELRGDFYRFEPGAVPRRIDAPIRFTNR